MINILKSMYRCVKSCIKYGNVTTDFVASEVGLKQGDPLSPIIFMFFINDISDSLNSDLDGLFTLNEIKIFMIFFADDACLFSLKLDTLQSMLNDLSDYCHTWALKINTNKTKIMVFEKGHSVKPKLYLNDEELEVVDSFKYLGVVLYKNGNWHRTQQHLAQHSMFALHKVLNVFHHVTLPVNEKCKLFDSMVGSILNFSSEVWGFHEAKHIETIHTKFCRHILCTRKSTNLEGLYGELGRYPLKIYRKIRIIKYWCRLLANRDSLPFQLFIMLKNDCESNNRIAKNWAGFLKVELENLGFADIWQNQFLIDIPFEIIKLRLIDNYKQSWFSSICNSSRLETYSRVKHEFGLESYLLNISIPKYRIALTQFRISAHNLTIETGRHLNVARENRVCTLCNMRCIESEYHMLLVCPTYRDLRNKYFPNYYCHWPNLQKFDSLMCCETALRQRNLAKFIYEAFRRRQEKSNA